VYGSILLLATAFAACVADPPSTALRVTITGADGRVVVTGPEGSRIFDEDGVWSVRPGRYEATIEPVREGDATVHAVESQRVITDPVGQTAELRAEYRVASDLTKIARDTVLSAIDTEATLAGRGIHPESGERAVRPARGSSRSRGAGRSTGGRPLPVPVRATWRPVVEAGDGTFSLRR
jgi:hypothetical protein